MQQEKICPYCQGGNSPTATQCQWCARYLTPPKGSGRKTLGWLMVWAGIVAVIVLGITFIGFTYQAVAGTTTVPFMGTTIMFVGIVLVLILPGVLLIRWKK